MRTMSWLAYLDGNQFGGECVKQLSLEDLKKELERVKRFREGKWREYGRDGVIEVWRRRYVYRGVPYEIAMLKYFSFNEPEPLNAIGFNNIGAYCVLEYVRDGVWNEVARLLRELELSERWLWEDTIHPDMENWTIPQMVEWLHKRAKEYIDFLLDDVETALEARIREMQEKAKRLSELIRQGLINRRG